MKKTISIILGAILTCSMLTACTTNENNNATPDEAITINNAMVSEDSTELQQVNNTNQSNTQTSNAITATDKDGNTTTTEPAETQTNKAAGTNSTNNNKSSGTTSGSKSTTSNSGNSGNSNKANNNTSGNNSNKSNNSGSVKTTQPATQKTTQVPTQKATQPATQKTTQPVTQKPTQPAIPAELKAYAKPYDTTTIKNAMISYGKSLGMKYDSSMTLNNSGWHPPEVSSWYDNNESGARQFKKYLMDSVYNMLKNLAEVDGESMNELAPYVRFNIIVESRDGGEYAFYVTYG